jgi:peptidoglycan hydrolase-like protein with peptidoglycan-binding domain
MSNSSLAVYTKLSPNCTKMSNKVNKKITIHHMAGNLSVETCGNVFQGSRKASANYGIGSDGRIGLYVNECDRAWTSSSSANDSQAVTIEVANCSGAPDWKVSDKAYAALIDLCVDICKRNNIKALEYTGDKSGNLTRHNMFTSTTCPGPYLQGKFSDIAAKVNERLGTHTQVAPQANVLTKGDSGAKVKALQENLIKLGYDLGGYGADGSFGPATEKAVKKFQKDHGLKQDGVVGAQTLAEIEAALKALTKKTSYTEKQFIEDIQRALGAGVDGIAGPITLSKTITVSARKNNRHPIVKFIQKRLYAMGYTEVGEDDGVAGAKFTKAVKRMQKERGKRQDGEITKGQVSWKVLLGMTK